MNKFVIILLGVVISAFSQHSLESEYTLKSKSFMTRFSIDYRNVESSSRLRRNLRSTSIWAQKFDIKSKAHFKNKYGQKDYQDYSFSFYLYENKDSCLKARKMYLNNYGSDGGRLTPTTKGVKKPPCFNIISDKSIVVFEASCEEVNMDSTWSWSRIKNELVAEFGSETSEMIENGCGSPILWTNPKN